MHAPCAAGEARESIEDIKTLIIGMKSTIGWVTYESAVTESVYKRFVAKDAQIKTSVKSRLDPGSAAGRGTARSGANQRERKLTSRR